jgi:hypothetical protein
MFPELHALYETKRERNKGKSGSKNAKSFFRDTKTKFSEHLS